MSSFKLFTEYYWSLGDRMLWSVPVELDYTGIESDMTAGTSMRQMVSNMASVPGLTWKTFYPFVCPPLNARSDSNIWIPFFTDTFSQQLCSNSFHSCFFWPSVLCSGWLPDLFSPLRLKQVFSLWINEWIIFSCFSAFLVHTQKTFFFFFFLLIPNYESKSWWPDCPEESWQLTVPSYLGL